MMSRRLYLLVTRSSFLLIVALVAAPVVDFWRFGRFVPIGGGVLPIGAILPGAREAQAKSPDPSPERVEVRAVPAGAPTPAPPAALPASMHAVERAAPAETARVAASVSGFEAWTAWGQVDPFWDGVERAVRRTAAADAAPAPAEPAETAEARDERAVAATESDASHRVAKKEAHAADRSLLRSREPRVETAGENDATDGEAGNDGGELPPPADGFIVGQPAQPSGGAEDGRLTPEPSPPPPTPPGGGVGPSRALPQQPRPRPIVYPTAMIQAPADLVSVGEVFDIVVRVDSVDQMTSLPFHLLFDPNVLGFESAMVGSALGALQPVLLASVNPNRPGDLAVGLSLLEASGSFSGTGDLIVLRFRALASGQSDLAFSRATLRGAASEPVDSRFTGGTVVVR